MPDPSINSGPMRVVYILPFYDEKTDTHLYYNYELIRDASGRMDIFVVIEKAGGGDISLGKAQFIVQKRKRGLPRFFEILGILRKCKREGYKDVYVHYSYYGALAAYFSGMKVFYWNRGMPWLFKRSFWEESVFRFILRHTIVVTSPESLAREYQRRYGISEYKILPNWIDAGRFRPQDDKKLEPKIILFVHHLSERKGADLIPEIAQDFKEDKVNFWVVGDGPYQEKLKIQSSKFKNIRLLGAIPNKDMVSYFQKAYLYLMPSREEGSPHALLDAMAAGTPFVASDVGGVRELVPPGFEEFLCPSEDVRCFQEKIKKLLSDRRLYEKFRREGLNFVASFDKARGIREFISFFGS